MVMYLLVTCTLYSVCTFGHIESVPFGSAAVAVGRRNWTKSFHSLVMQFSFTNYVLRFEELEDENEYENQYAIVHFSAQTIEVSVGLPVIFYIDSNNKKYLYLKKPHLLGPGLL